MDLNLGNVNIHFLCNPCECSIVIRIHGNKHKQPAHSLSVRDVQEVVEFLRNYAEDHAILLPGRIPGYNRFDLKLLSSSTTKFGVWEVYNTRVIGHCSFINTWSKYLPEIIVTKPMSAWLVLDMSALSSKEVATNLRKRNQW